MEDFTNKWHLVNKGRNGKYCHLKKCQNMEVVNYFTNLPFPIFTKNFFPYFTNCEKLHKLELPFIYQNIPRASKPPCESAKELALEQSHCLKRDLINYQYNIIISNKN